MPTASAYRETECEGMKGDGRLLLHAGRIVLFLDFTASWLIAESQDFIGYFASGESYFG
jgi:hypothetical protein